MYDIGGRVEPLFEGDGLNGHCQSQHSMVEDICCQSELLNMFEQQKVLLRQQESHLPLFETIHSYLSSRTNGTADSKLTLHSESAASAESVPENLVGSSCNEVKNITRRGGQTAVCVGVKTRDYKELVECMLKRRKEYEERIRFERVLVEIRAKKKCRSEETPQREISVSGEVQFPTFSAVSATAALSLCAASSPSEAVSSEEKEQEVDVRKTEESGRCNSGADDEEDETASRSLRSGFVEAKDVKLEEGPDKDARDCIPLMHSDIEFKTDVSSETDLPPSPSSPRKAAATSAKVLSTVVKSFPPLTSVRLRALKSEASRRRKLRASTLALPKLRNLINKTRLLSRSRRSLACRKSWMAKLPSESLAAVCRQSQPKALRRNVKLSGKRSVFFKSQETPSSQSGESSGEVPQKETVKESGVSLSNEENAFQQSKVASSRGAEGEVETQGRSSEVQGQETSARRGAKKARPFSATSNIIPCHGQAKSNADFKSSEESLKSDSPPSLSPLERRVLTRSCWKQLQDADQSTHVATLKESEEKSGSSLARRQSQTENTASSKSGADDALSSKASKKRVGKPRRFLDEIVEADVVTSSATPSDSSPAKHSRKRGALDLNTSPRRASMRLAGKLTPSQTEVLEKSPIAQHENPTATSSLAKKKKVASVSLPSTEGDNHSSPLLPALLHRRRFQNADEKSKNDAQEARPKEKEGSVTVESNSWSSAASRTLRGALSSLLRTAGTLKDATALKHSEKLGAEKDSTQRTVKTPLQRRGQGRVCNGKVKKQS